MIYAIDENKVHRVLSAGDIIHYLNEGEKIVQADSDGWIEWRGGDCPLPDDIMCQVILDSYPNEPTRKLKAGLWRWGKFSGLTAYRPILNAEEKEMKQEWKPEAGAKAQTSSGECEILAVDFERGMVSVRWSDGELGTGRMDCVKPLPTDRSRWIEEAELACEDVPDGDIDLIYGALYDAGLAKLPNQGESQ